MIYENSSILGYHIEAIPKIYEELNAKCLVTKSQIAICACLADEPGKEVTFNIASNNALSSSIFPLGRHKVEYPDISYRAPRKINNTLDSGMIPIMIC